MNHNELRDSFLKYFESKEHKIISSSPVIPYNDPTLMFTNAGMNQFKEVLLGNEIRSYKRATSVQKCIRVSGKHNDFEVVGFDGYHHTFFEMLGNWSFGDYYKKEAIEFAWEYLTKILKFPESKLVVSVYKDDDESYEIWNRIIKIPASKIARLGDIEKGDEENFWSMGETGPCGPCTEIYYDMGEKFNDTSAGEGIGYNKRYMELWNLVFMEFYRDASGKFTPLKFKSVDTGMGFERLYALIQGKYSNYHTDLFMPIIAKIEELTGKKYKDKENEVGFQVIADHIRALCFAIADGGVFSNEGRGYVLRKILRRAERYFKKLGLNEPSLYKLVDTVVNIMGNFYPELKEKRAEIEKFIKIEEERFLATLESGLRMLTDIFKKMEKEKQNVISGENVFTLYDTYGFPVDIVKEIAREHNYSIDEQKFQELMEQQRERGRKSWAGEKKIIDEEKILKLLKHLPDTEHICYDTTESISNILAIIKEDNLVDRVSKDDICGILLDITPFYAESGGQVGDKGIIETPDFKFEVNDTQKYGNRYIIHWGQVIYGDIKPDTRVDAKVDEKLRNCTAKNHTATHLLQAALRKIVGSHITQAGSYVGPDRLRFDFRHYEPLTAEQIEQIEKIVNQKIQENLKVEKFIEEKDKALKMGAMAIFGEKYGEKVRVVKAGDFSIELCGGTHLDYTGEIGLFIILSESSIAAGIRRIEAITSQTALEYVLNLRKNLVKIANLFKVSPDESFARVKKLVEINKELEKKIEQLKFSSGIDIISEILKNRKEKNGASLIVYKFKNEDSKYLNTVADKLQKKIGSGIIFLINQTDKKVNLVLALTEDIVKKGKDASELIKPLAQIIGGNGGGRKDRAQAGGKLIKNIDKLIKNAERDLIKIL